VLNGRMPRSSSRCIRSTPRTRVPPGARAPDQQRGLRADHPAVLSAGRAAPAAAEGEEELEEIATGRGGEAGQRKGKTSLFLAIGLWSSVQVSSSIACREEPHRAHRSADDRRPNAFNNDTYGSYKIAAERQRSSIATTRRTR
jgi:hypothetical protein